MKKIFNSIKHKGSRENLSEPRRSRGSVEVRRSGDIRRDHDLTGETSHNTPASSSATAPSHAALNLKASEPFLDASEYPDDTPRHAASSSLGGQDKSMMEAHGPSSLSRDTTAAAAAVAPSSLAGNRTSDPPSRRAPSGPPSTIVNTTTTTTVGVTPRSAAVQPLSPSNTAPRNIDQPLSNTRDTSNMGVASNTATAPKTATSPTSATHSATFPMPSATTSTSPRGTTPVKNKVLDPDVRLPQGFDINDSEDTDRGVTYSKAVVHETVKPLRHHIVHEQIVREIHNHDVYHRILPIIDVEVLPAKHYVQDPKNPMKLLEVAEHEVPGYRGPGKHNWQIVETVSKLDSAPRTEKVGSRFTARTFSPTEGVTHEWTDDQGTQRSERTWIHAPVSARREGTVPLYMGTWPEHEVSVATETNPGWPGMPGHHTHSHGLSGHDHPSTLKSTTQRTGEDSRIAYRPTAGARSASNRSDYLRLVDQGLDNNDNHTTTTTAHNNNKRGTNGIETVNAGMSGLAV